MSQHTGRRLTDWYAVNSLVLNIKKTKELILDLRRKKGGSSASGDAVLVCLDEGRAKHKSEAFTLLDDLGPYPHLWAQALVVIERMRF